MATMDWGALQQLADSEKFELLPEDTYVFQVTKAEIKPTQKGNGVNVSLQCKILEGPLAGRTSFGNIFIANPGSDVKAGAYGMMNAKLNAIGVPLAVLAAHNATLEQAAALFMGKTFLGGVKHREWNNATRDGIDSIAPLPSAQFNGGSSMSAFGGGMMGQAAQQPAQQPAMTAAAPTEPTGFATGGVVTSTEEAPKAPW